MNAFEFGFYDELEKIAAKELYKVRPDVSQALAKDIRQMYRGKVRELPRKRGESRLDVTFDTPDGERKYNFERPGDAEIIGSHRKEIAAAKGELLRAHIARVNKEMDREMPGWHKMTHLPGFGRHEPGYLETLPGGDPNPWGRKIPQPPPRPPMPKPVRP